MYNDYYWYYRYNGPNPLIKPYSVSFFFVVVINKAGLLPAGSTGYTFRLVC